MKTFETKRAYLYPLIMAVVGLLGTYGLLDENAVASWGALVTALLGTGMASLFTSVPSKVKETADEIEDKLPGVNEVISNAFEAFGPEALGQLFEISDKTDSAGRPLVGRHSKEG